VCVQVNIEIQQLKILFQYCLSFIQKNELTVGINRIPVKTQLKTRIQVNDYQHNSFILTHNDVTLTDLCANRAKINIK